MIIEFNGLPGVGKSTIAKYLAKILSEDYYIKTKLPTTGDKRTLKIVDYVTYPWNTFLLLNKWCKDNKFTDIRSYSRFIKGTIGFKEKYEQINSDSEMIYIIDQGLVQSIVSIAYLSEITSTRKLENFVHNLKVFPSFIINCDLDINLISERIRNRATNYGRLDSMNDEELQSALQIQKTNLILVRNLFRGYCADISLDTSLPPMNNAQIIQNMIMREG